MPWLQPDSVKQHRMARDRWNIGNGNQRPPSANPNDSAQEWEEGECCTFKQTVITSQWNFVGRWTIKQKRHTVVTHSRASSCSSSAASVEKRPRVQIRIPSSITCSQHDQPKNSSIPQPKANSLFFPQPFRGGWLNYSYRLFFHCRSVTERMDGAAGIGVCLQECLKDVCGSVL